MSGLCNFAKMAGLSHPPFAGGGSLKSLDSSCVMTHSGDRTKKDATIRKKLVGKLTDHLKRGASFQAPLPNGQSVWLPSMPFED